MTPQPSENECHLVDAIRNGDNRAWVKLVEEVGPRLAGFATARGVSEPEDFTQEVLLAVATRIPSFDGDDRSFRSWVFSIAYRRAMDHHRVRYRQPELVPLVTDFYPDAGETPESLALAQTDSAAALAALDVLKPLERDIVTLRVLGELSAEEVARVVEKRPGTVRVIQSRALAKMRTHLEEEQKLRNAGLLGAITGLNMRLLRRPYADHRDPLSGSQIGTDPIVGWAESLRTALLVNADPASAATLAERAAEIVTAATVSSLTMGTGVAAGTATGGITMTTATTAASTTTGLSALLSVKGLVATVTAATAITGAAVVTGNLPDPAQTAAARLGANVGLALPGAAIAEAVETIEVGSAGWVTVELRDGVVTIVDIDGQRGWDVGATAESNDGATVELVSDEAITTLTATVDATGEIVADVTTQAAASADIDINVDAENQTTTDTTIGNSTGADSETDGTVSVNVDLGVDVNP